MLIQMFAMYLAEGDVIQLNEGQADVLLVDHDLPPNADGESIRVLLKHGMRAVKQFFYRPDDQVRVEVEPGDLPLDWSLVV